MIFAVVVLCVLSSVCSARVVIVVNKGGFSGVEAGAYAEERVDWRDDDLVDDAACTECFAAVELRRFLVRCTDLKAGEIVFGGVGELPLQGDVFILGSRESNPLTGKNRMGKKVVNSEGFAITAKRDGGRIVTVIEGGGRVGVLYGVYEYIERLGVRFYGLGDVYDDRAGKRAEARDYFYTLKDGKRFNYDRVTEYKVPSAGTVYPAGKVGLIEELDIAEEPSYLTRGFHVSLDRGNEEFYRWMARRRFNYWTAKAEGKTLLHKLGIRLSGGGHVVQSLCLPPAGQWPYNHVKFKGDEDKPADPFGVSAEYIADADGDGKLSYFEAHPEWYGLIGGKRSDNIRGEFGHNFCTSNADARRELAENVVRELILGAWREVDVLNFWMLDNAKWCECSECVRQGSYTDRLMVVAGDVLAAIKRARADGRLSREVLVVLPAYRGTLAGPTKKIAGLDYEGLSVTFFPIERCYFHEFSDEKCGINGPMRRNLAEWTSKEGNYAGPMFIGEYYNVSLFKSLPIVYGDLMAADVRWYYGQGARHFDFMHVLTRDWGSWGYDYYLLSRLLWDVGADGDAVQAEYIAGCYPSCSAEMGRFFQLCGKVTPAFTAMRIWGWTEKLMDKKAEVFGDNHLAYKADGDGDKFGIVEAIRYYDQAEKLIEKAYTRCEQGLQKQRVAETRQRFYYGKASLHFYYHLVNVSRSWRAGEDAQAKAEFSQVKQWAAKLREVKELVHAASNDANCEDGFAATRKGVVVYEFFDKIYGNGEE
jgi:hypothetical protein